MCVKSEMSSVEEICILQHILSGTSVERRIGGLGVAYYFEVGRLFGALSAERLATAKGDIYEKH